MLLLCGRQTGKSTLAALLALWAIVMWPEKLVLLISPTLRQSTELFRKCMVMLDAMDRPPAIVQRSKTEIRLANGSMVVSLPGANADTIRGYSKPDLIIEDEAAFVPDLTFTATRPMLATNPNARHLLLTTPYGRRGHFYDRWRANDPDWTRFRIRSDECPRIARSFLEGEKRVLSDRAYRQEYCCEFLEAATAVFPADVVERLVDDNRRKVELPDSMKGEAMSLQSLMTGPGPWAEL